MCISDKFFEKYLIITVMFAIIIIIIITDKEACRTKN
jgi:hypothetical protein